MKINTYDLTITGLKEASGMTKGLNGYYNPAYVELFYDRSTGEAWGKWQYSLGQSTWTKYDDPDVIKIGTICEPKTMQELADLIHKEMEIVKNTETYYKEQMDAFVTSEITNEGMKR